MSTERDELISQLEPSRVVSGDIATKQDAVLRTRRQVDEADAQSRRELLMVRQREDREYLREYNAASNKTESIERRLLQLIPTEAKESLRKLDLAIARLREMPGMDAADIEYLHKLQALLAESSDLHLLPIGKLKNKLSRISAALDRVEELITA